MTIKPRSHYRLEKVSGRDWFEQQLGAGGRPGGLERIGEMLLVAVDGGLVPRARYARKALFFLLDGAGCY